MYNKPSLMSVAAFGSLDFEIHPENFCGAEYKSRVCIFDGAIDGFMLVNHNLGLIILINILFKPEKPDDKNEILYKCVEFYGINFNGAEN